MGSTVMQPKRAIGRVIGALPRDKCVTWTRSGEGVSRRTRSSGRCTGVVLSQSTVPRRRPAPNILADGVSVGAATKARLAEALG
jgi:hypothetical protein